MLLLSILGEVPQPQLRRQRNGRDGSGGGGVGRIDRSFEANTLRIAQQRKRGHNRGKGASYFSSSSSSSSSSWPPVRVAYAAQQPWIFHGTLRDNVLFGLEMVPERYCDVLAACGLLPDLHQLAGTAPTPLSSSPPSPPDASASLFRQVAAESRGVGRSERRGPRPHRRPWRHAEWRAAGSRGPGRAALLLRPCCCLTTRSPPSTRVAASVFRDLLGRDGLLQRQGGRGSSSRRASGRRCLPTATSSSDSCAPTASSSSSSSSGSEYNNQSLTTGDSSGGGGRVECSYRQEGGGASSSGFAATRNASEAALQQSLQLLRCSHGPPKWTGVRDNEAALHLYSDCEVVAASGVELTTNVMFADAATTPQL